MRGRGLARLIRHAMEGDPVAIGVLSLVGVAVVVWVVYTAKTGPRG